MASLYEIDQRILALADPETGEITDFEALEELSVERNSKIENVALWYKNLLAEAEMIKAEYDNLRKRKEACENKAKSLSRYLEAALCGEKFTTPRVSCTFRKSESVQINDLSKIPFTYLKYAEPTADKIAIKQAIKSGKEVEGAELVDKLSLSIK